MRYKSFIIGYIIYFINYGVLFGINSILANQYPVSIFGEYNFYLSIMIVLSTFTHLGTNQSFLTLGQKGKIIRRLLVPFMTLRLLGYSVLFPIITFIFFLFDVKLMGYLYLIYALPLALNSSIVFDYLGESEKEIKYIFVYNYDIEYIILSRIMSKSISEIRKWLYIKRKFKIKTKNKIKNVYWIFKKSFRYLFSRLIVEIYVRNEIIFIGIIGSMSEVGVFSAAYSVFIAILFAEGFFNRKIIPKLVSSLSSKNQLIYYLKIGFIVKVSFYVPVTIFMVIFGADFIFTYVIVNSDYNQGSQVLSILQVGLLTSIFNINMNIIMYTGRLFLYNIRFIFGLCSQITLGYIGYQFYGLLGYVWALQIARWMGTIYSIIISTILIRKIKT